MTKLHRIEHARKIARENGWSLRVRGLGDDRHLYFTHSDGRTFHIWYPVGARCHDSEERDLDDALTYMKEGE
jgi:hypothetical protein